MSNRSVVGLAARRRWASVLLAGAGLALSAVFLAPPALAAGEAGSAPGEAAAATAPADPAEDISLFGSYLAGRHASGERDRTSAADFFSDALKLDPDNRMLLERAMLYELSAARYAEGLELAPKVIAAVPDNLGANLLLGLDAMLKGRYAEARLRFANDDSGPIARLAAGLLEAWSYQAGGQPLRAREVLEGLDDAASFGAFHAYHAGLLAEMQGRDEDAAESYKTAYETAPGLRTIDAYGRLLERLGRGDEAIAMYRQFLDESPNHPIIVADLQRAEAGTPADPLVANAFDGAAETLYAMGSALTQDGGGDLALIYLNLALYVRPEFSIASFLVADIHDRQSRHEEAIAAYSAVEPDHPLKREAEIQAALNLDSLDRTDEARERLDGLIENDPADVTALVSAGTMLRARQRFDEALSYYDKAIALLDEPDNNDWQLYYFRGICYERTDQWELAEADLEKALELEPDQPLVLNYLGYSWIDLGMHLDEGLAMVEKAVEQRPEDGYIVDSLGWAFYRLGDYERAVKELERAVELRPDDAVINDHLGDAYWQVGRRLEARFQWSHALVSDPEEDEIPKIRAKLAEGLPATTRDLTLVASTDPEAAAAAAAPTGAAEPEETGEVPDKPADTAAETDQVEEDAGAAEPAATASETPAATEEPEAAEPAAEAPEAEPEVETARVAPSPEAEPPSSRVHTIVVGDTLWDLAEEYLGDARLFGAIFDANRDRIENVRRLRPGAELVIPARP